MRMPALNPSNLSVHSPRQLKSAQNALRMGNFADQCAERKTQPDSYRRQDCPFKQRIKRYSQRPDGKECDYRGMNDICSIRIWDQKTGYFSLQVERTPEN